MNALDRRVVEELAARLRARPGSIEKDWHMTQALAVLAAMDHGGAIPAFGGGTSLSKAWHLTQRFSEDIDFKVAMPDAVSRNKGKAERSAYRQRVIDALTTANFELSEEPFKRDENRFFSADLVYPSMFEAGQGLRPHLRIEMSLEGPVQPTTARPISSLVGRALRQPPEVPAFACVDPVETAADKLSALAWRVQARDRTRSNDDPTIVRHLHDLAALQTIVATSPAFSDLVGRAFADDRGRGGGMVLETSGPEAFEAMFERLTADHLWAAEYERYVQQVSFAEPGSVPDFTEALAAVRALTAQLQDNPEQRRGSSAWSGFPDWTLEELRGAKSAGEPATAFPDWTSEDDAVGAEDAEEASAQHKPESGLTR